MTKKIKGLIAIGLLGTTMLLGGCTDPFEDEADTVNYNITKEADNFNTVRQVTVINCLQGETLFQMTGLMSITADTSDNQLEIIVKDGDSYRKHFIGLSDNVTYVIEDISDGDVDSFNYTLYFNPKMWVPNNIKVRED